MKNFFCTLFDHRYLDRGLALYDSMSLHCGDFMLFILCMDLETHDTLIDMKLNNVHILRIEDLEHFDSMLKKIKKTRTSVEYYFTCKSSLVLYAFSKINSVSMVTYVDADMFFYSSFETICNMIGEKSIAITPHRFGEKRSSMEKYGKYNAGFVSFRNDENGASCLNWWHEKCIDWCHDYIEDGKYADQKYIDDFPLLFEGVAILESPGVNLAPWNILGKKISKIGNFLHVDNEKIVCYHFHGVKSASNIIFDLGLKKYLDSISRETIGLIYKPYIYLISEKRKKFSINDSPLRRGKIKYYKKFQLNIFKGKFFSLLCKKIIYWVCIPMELKKGRCIIGKI